MFEIKSIGMEFMRERINWLRSEGYDGKAIVEIMNRGMLLPYVVYRNKLEDVAPNISKWIEPFISDVVLICNLRYKENAQRVTLEK